MILGRVRVNHLLTRAYWCRHLDTKQTRAHAHTHLSPLCFHWMSTVQWRRSRASVTFCLCANGSLILTALGWNVKSPFRHLLFMATLCLRLLMQGLTHCICLFTLHAIHLVEYSRNKQKKDFSWNKKKIIIIMKMYFLVFVKNTHKNTLIILLFLRKFWLMKLLHEKKKYIIYECGFCIIILPIQSESCRISLTVQWWLNCPLATIVQNNDYKLFSIVIFLMERQALLQLVFLVNTFTVSCLRPGCSQMRKHPHWHSCLSACSHYSSLSSYCRLRSQLTEELQVTRSQLPDIIKTIIKLYRPSLIQTPSWNIKSFP